jgi:preprotein translocase subunit SecY
MIAAFANIFKVPELRNRVLFTLWILALCRLAANVPCPGIDPAELNKLFDEVANQGDAGGGGLLALANTFTGGALRRFAVGALGIMPYISASIVMSMLGPVWPYLEKLKREGESGRQKINQWTRYLTLAICIVQGFLLAKAMENPGTLLNLDGVYPIVVSPGLGFQLMTVVILTCGAFIIMWLGEQITDRGVGNGASLIITVSIIEQLPAACGAMWGLMRSGGSGSVQFTPIHVIILVAMFVIVTAATVAMTLGVRKVPIQYAGANAGRGGMSGQASFFPLRVNFANVMPIIFASAILMFPPMIIGRFPWLAWSAPWFTYGTTEFMVLYGVLIIAFAFFWVANQFNPIRIADDLKRQGAYIPGIRPGKPTADFLDKSMTRVTMAGSVFLMVLALLPMIASTQMQVPYLIAGYFGGASLLIIVSVLLDTMRQVNSHLMTHRYDGFMTAGSLRRGRRTTTAGGIG